MGRTLLISCLPAFCILAYKKAAAGIGGRAQQTIRYSKGVAYMNILFFLKPKSELDLVYEGDSIGMAIERIECHQFSSIPMISDKTGKYIGTLSEGDLLRALRRSESQDVRSCELRSVMNVRRKRDYKSVRADADIEKLFSYVKEQNFVPVVDDTGVLIGIVLRSTILEFMFAQHTGNHAPTAVHTPAQDGAC